MSDCDRRHICFSDLQNYLRKKDYLSGFSEVEQYQIRQNIDAASKQDIQNLIDNNSSVQTTYNELLDLVKNNQLHVGTNYSITDFQTIYESNVTDEHEIKQTWGLDINPSPIFNVTITAIDSNTFSTNATIISNEYPNSNKWKVLYDFKQEVLEDGKTTKGKILYLKDNNNNEAYYDFKSIKFRKSKKDLKTVGIDIEEEYKDCYTFNTPDFIDSSESANVYNNQFQSNCYNNIFIGDTYCNSFYSGFINNVFADKCYQNYFGFNTSDNKFKIPITQVSGSLSGKVIENQNILSQDVDKKIVKATNQNYTILYIDSDTKSLKIETII